MLKEMSVNLTENVLVIFCQYIIRFFYGFLIYSAYLFVELIKLCEFMVKKPPKNKYLSMGSEKLS